MFFRLANVHMHSCGLAWLTAALLGCSVTQGPPSARPEAPAVSPRAAASSEPTTPSTSAPFHAAPSLEVTEGDATFRDVRLAGGSVLPEARIHHATAGGDDAFNPVELGILEQSMRRVSRGTLVVQPGTSSSFGHFTQAHPELWSEHVGRFLRDLGAGGSR